MNRVSKFGLAVCCSLTFVSVGMAQGKPMTPKKEAQQAVKLRQALFDVQSFAFGPMVPFLKGAPFNATAAETAGRRIEMTSSMIPEVFKFDTRKYTGKYHIETRARPAIWKNFADFTQDAQNLNMAAMGLVAAAKSGSSSMTRQAAIKVGKACGKCHDDYRLKK